MTWVMIMRLPHGKPIEKNYETQFPNIQMLKDEIGKKI